MTTKTEGQVVYGDVSFPPEAFEPKHTRVRISIMIPEDVLTKLRELGAKKGKGYQTVANEILREAVARGGELGERFAIIKGQQKISKQLEEIQTGVASMVARAVERGKKPVPKRAAKKR